MGNYYFLYDTEEYDIIHMHNTTSSINSVSKSVLSNFRIMPYIHFCVPSSVTGHYTEYMH